MVSTRKEHMRGGLQKVGLKFRIVEEVAELTLQKVTSQKVTVERDLVNSIGHVQDSPKSIPLNRNLCPLRLLYWKMVICVAAPSMYKNMKTAVTGTSTCFFGMPPKAQVVGRYGPDDG
jgi:hypothetical protein